MNILVTGGAGFIASHIVDQLIISGHHVHIFDNLSTGRKENLNPLAVFHQGDLLDNELTDAFRCTPRSRDSSCCTNRCSDIAY